MAFIITGGAGFIGSNLVKKLLESEEKVFVIDDFSLGDIKNLNKRDRNLTVFQESCSKIPEIRKIGYVEHVFHLGTPSSAPIYAGNRTLQLRTVEEFEVLTDFCRKSDAGLSLASSSSVYGNLSPPHKESADVKPFDGYTTTKIAMEEILKTFHEKYGLSGVALRLFSVYGPGESHKGQYANLVSQFIWKMYAGKGPVIYGDGSQSRDFIHVSDVVDAFIASAGFGSYEILNVGTGISSTLNELVALINSSLKSNIKPEYVKNPVVNYVMHTKADINKAKRYLGFEYAISLISGIKDLIGNKGLL